MTLIAVFFGFVIWLVVVLWFAQVLHRSSERLIADLEEDR